MTNIYIHMIVANLVWMEISDFNFIQLISYLFRFYPLFLIIYLLYYYLHLSLIISLNLILIMIDSVHFTFFSNSISTHISISNQIYSSLN